MREIKYRGKRIDNGKWVYGSYVKLTGTESDPYGEVFFEATKHYIQEQVNFDYCVDYMFEVDPETVGQYTGLKDRNGKDIYEGDIVQYTSNEKVGERRVSQKRGYDTYSVYDDVQIKGVVKYGMINRPFEKDILYYVDTDMSVSYGTYFWGSGKKSDRPEMKSSNLTKPLRNNVEYEVIGNVWEDENPSLLEVTNE